jgi:hypothetical protein
VVRKFLCHGLHDVSPGEEVKPLSVLSKMCYTFLFSCVVSGGKISRPDRVGTIF